MELGLKDKVILITGSGGVLGAAFVKGFANLGSKLAVNDLKEEKAIATIENLKSSNFEAIPVAADVSSDEDVKNMVNKTVQHFGTIDILINAAAVQIYPAKFIHEVEPSEWDLVSNIILKAVYLSARHVIPIMKENGGGKIINVASIAGHRGIPGGAPYSAAKGGVLNLTRQLAVELGPHKINVNSVSPGFTPNRLTTIYEYQAVTEGKNEPIEPKSFHSSFSGPPLERMGEVNDFVGPVLFLASNWSNYISGIDIPVEGGRMAVR
tara:strand:+ start:148 stop:945 length:798 start_codon:yes stop_codon:yes gene_type:complete